MTVMYQTIDLNLPIPDLDHRHFEREHRSLSTMKSLAVTRVHDRKSRNSVRFLQSLTRSLSMHFVSATYHPIKYQISSMKTLFLEIQSLPSTFLLYYVHRVKPYSWSRSNKRFDKIFKFEKARIYFVG